MSAVSIPWANEDERKADTNFLSPLRVEGRRLQLRRSQAVGSHSMSVADASSIIESALVPMGIYEPR